jgi:hypothetical protein
MSTVNKSSQKYIPKHSRDLSTEEQSQNNNRFNAEYNRTNDNRYRSNGRGQYRGREQGRGRGRGRGRDSYNGQYYNNQQFQKKKKKEKEILIPELGSMSDFPILLEPAKISELKKKQPIINKTVNDNVDITTPHNPQDAISLWSKYTELPKQIDEYNNVK